MSDEIVVDVFQQCARCGSSVERVQCEHCGGDGTTAPGELYEQDPLWYDEDDTDPCSVCGGASGWTVCVSDAAWCEAHPLPGHEGIKRGEIDEYGIEREPASPAPVIGGEESER
jgi:hypothetical protein